MKHGVRVKYCGLLDQLRAKRLGTDKKFVPVWEKLREDSWDCCGQEVIHFCHKRKLHPDPELYLNKHPISVVKEIKFLGIVFDSKLNFKAHILYLRNKCLKSLNLKIIADKDWGADQKTPHFIQNTNSFQTRVWFLYLWFNSKVLPLSTKYRSYSSPPDLHWSIPNFSN